MFFKLREWLFGNFHYHLGGKRESFYERAPWRSLSYRRIVCNIIILQKYRIIPLLHFLNVLTLWAKGKIEIATFNLMSKLLEKSLARTKIATNFSMARVLSVAKKMGKVLWLASNYWLRWGNVILVWGKFRCSIIFIRYANSVFNNATSFRSSSSSSSSFPIQLPALNKSCWKGNLKLKLSNRQRSIFLSPPTESKINIILIGLFLWPKLLGIVFVGNFIKEIRHWVIIIGLGDISQILDDLSLK